MTQRNRQPAEVKANHFFQGRQLGSGMARAARRVNRRMARAMPLSWCSPGVKKWLALAVSPPFLAQVKFPDTFPKNDFSYAIMADHSINAEPAGDGPGWRRPDFNNPIWM